VRLTFLGTGTSFGVPQIGCSCAVCRSSDPRDKRTRVGAYVESDAGTRILLDTPTELRLQCVAAGITDIDAVIFTHEHADHLHGIDDLRSFTMKRRDPLPLYGDASTLATLRSRFPYIVDPNIRQPPGTTRPEGKLVEVQAGTQFSIADVAVLPFAVPHGTTTVLAYRIGDLGYVTDTKELTPSALKTLTGVRVLVLNALLRKPHPTHLSISEAVAAAQRVGAERTYFTHLTHDNFHADLESELPSGIAPAYDGLTIRI
jgi:phosphoribosyl 1,2-cyclic phosphate phosphodiesterase